MNIPFEGIIKSEEDAHKKLSLLGQKKLLSHWQNLSPSQKKYLKHQIADLDISFIRFLQNKIHRPIDPLENYLPYVGGVKSGHEENSERGVENVRKGKCGCLILAGGQGSRLKCQGSKGVFPVTKFSKKCLFQIIAEKVKAACKQVNYPLQIAFMTSPENHEETIVFFLKNNFFGLTPEQVSFFQQEEWPLLNLEGGLFLESPEKIATGPCGNGGVFRHFINSGLWDKWNHLGIKHVNLIPIDNPLALPFDYELLGFHIDQKNDVTIKAIEKKKPQEKVGVLVEQNGKIQVVEYTELPESERKSKTEFGNLKFRFTYIGLFCCSMSFIREQCRDPLPIHLAKKSVKMLGNDGETHFPNVPNAYKFEEFIFDLFPRASVCGALIYPRDECFAPLKNLEGEDSIESVQSALADLDRKTYAKVTGQNSPEHAEFELSAEFYYPTEEFLQRWRGKKFPNKKYIGDQ